MDGKKKLEELVALAEADVLRTGWERVTHDTIRSISDAYEAMEERAEKAEAALAIARPAILEEAAQVADECTITLPLTTGVADGGSISRRQIASAIRALAHTTGQEGGR